MTEERNLRVSTNVNLCQRDIIVLMLQNIFFLFHDQDSPS